MNDLEETDLGIDFSDESSVLVKNNQDNDLNGNKLTKVDTITVNSNPTSDNELSTKKYIDEELEKNTILRFNQTLETYLKVSVGYDTYNLTKFDKIPITDTTIYKAPNSGGYLFQQWNIKCNDKNNNGKIQKINESTTTNTATSDSGATSLPPIGDSFMYIETSSNNHGNNVFFSFERTDIIQTSNITFYCNRISILTIDSLKSMGRFRIQLLSEDNTWSFRYNIPKDDRYSDTSTDWTLVNLNFTVNN